ncbi:MAG: DUF2178 domain-containing protein [archaeon]|jgi:uncharacterized membrane protein
MEKKMRMTLKFGWGLSLIIIGLLLNQLNIGTNTFSGFDSVGTYLTYIGFLGLIIIGISEAWRKKRVVDERMEYVAAKALRITFVCTIIAAFLIIVADGINPITLPYHLFVSYAICGTLIIYFVSYNVLLRYR